MDLPFLMLVVMLVGIGLIVVFSASYAAAYYDEDISSPLFYIQRQAVFACLGLAVMYAVSRVNYQRLRWLSVPMLLGTIVLLVLVLTPLGVELNNAQRWLKLFFIAGPTYQPSELAKISIIVFFAARLSKRNTEKKRKFSTRTFTGRALNFMEKIGLLELLPYIGVLGLVLILVVMEPHMSGTILIMVGAAAVLFAAGISLGWFLSVGSLAVGGLLLIIFTTDYMTKRVELWLDPWLDPQGKGFQTIQSLLSIGSGGLLGKGLGNSAQKFEFLPEPENDFVFSVAVEELGFVGGALILILFMLLIMRGYWLALHSRDKFGSLLIVGIMALLSVQVFFNIGVVTNLIPNTGISLPFFSYGGTALVIHLAEMGVVLSVSRQIPAPKKD
ncbi:MAG: FtsW/RodA/SpoVE family cell cycle protein [Clostridium sp.]|nr:FtsW/RodA/SpoVE family cell cycle protein [Clostridium sp.]